MLLRVRLVDRLVGAGGCHCSILLWKGISVEVVLCDAAMEGMPGGLAEDGGMDDGEQQGGRKKIAPGRCLVSSASQPCSSLQLCTQPCACSTFERTSLLSTKVRMSAAMLQPQVWAKCSCAYRRPMKQRTCHLPAVSGQQRQTAGKLSLRSCLGSYPWSWPSGHVSLGKCCNGRRQPASCGRSR